MAYPVLRMWVAVKIESIVRSFFEILFVLMLFVSMMSLNDMSYKYFMFKNLNNHGIEYIESFEKNSDSSILFMTSDQNGKKKKLDIFEKDYFLTSNNIESIKKINGKYNILLNNQSIGRIERIKTEQHLQRIHEINKVNEPKKEDVSEIILIIFVLAMLIVCVCFIPRRH